MIVAPHTIKNVKKDTAMKPKIVCLFLLFAIVFVAGCPVTKPTKESVNNNESANAGKTSDIEAKQTPAGDLTVEYKDATYPFQFKIPADWQYMEKYENSVVTAIGPVDAQGYFPSVNVRAAKTDPNVLNTAQKDFETMMKKRLANYNLLTFETIKFGNYDALHTKSTYTPAPDLSMTQEHFMFNAGEFAYVITCSRITSHYQDSEETFKSILASFEFE